jgi:methylmalonyl-CoA mutase N-terminal domain/subunit
VQAAVESGLEVDEFAPRIAFFFNSHNQFLEEVAKFRAARRLWARIMRERFNARDPRSQMLRFHAQTAGSSLTAQQPEVNIVRTTIQALAAVLGGAQSLHTNSMDEALGLPTERAARIALRTQQVIAYESGVADTADPLGGAYSIEHLTNEIERLAADYIQKIDEIGGMLRAIEKGYVQREIEHAAYDYQRRVESGEQTVVGMNRFTSDEATSVPVLRLDPELERQQIERLNRVRARRDEGEVSEALKEVERAARTDENLMPHIVRAVEAYATLGEISDRLRVVFGEYTGAGSE